MNIPLDKRTRAYKIYKAGVDALPQDEIPGAPLLSAIAAMIDYATKKQSRKTAKPVNKVSAQKAFEIIARSEAVICEPIDKRWFGRLAKEITELSLDEGAILEISDYLSEGGWRGPKPTFGKLLQYFSTIAGRACSGEESRVTKALKHV